MQCQVTAEYIIPFIESHVFECNGNRVLEIGCAEAGVLKAFIDHGNMCVGVELLVSRYESDKEFLKIEIQENIFLIINKNIYEISDPKSEFGELFDLIILKDVIEHIPDQEKFISHLRNFLNVNGAIFFCLSTLVHAFWWTSTNVQEQVS